MIRSLYPDQGIQTVDEKLQFIRSLTINYVKSHHILCGRQKFSRQQLVLLSHLGLSCLWTSKHSYLVAVCLLGSTFGNLQNHFVNLADGRLRQFSLAQLGCNGGKSHLKTNSSKKTSSSFLRASILGLHVVQNPRTREKFIVGGGDDGSVAFWSFKYILHYFIADVD